MNQRTAAWLAWSSFAIALVCLAGVLLLPLIAPNTAASGGDSPLTDLLGGTGVDPRP
jgi:hypothetical protein